MIRRMGSRLESLLVKVYVKVNNIEKLCNTILESLEDLDINASKLDEKKVKKWVTRLKK